MDLIDANLEVTSSARNTNSLRRVENFSAYCDEANDFLRSPRMSLRPARSAFDGIETGAEAALLTDGNTRASLVVAFTDDCF